MSIMWLAILLEAQVGSKHFNRAWVVFAQTLASVYFSTIVLSLSTAPAHLRVQVLLAAGFWRHCCFASCSVSVVTCSDLELTWRLSCLVVNYSPMKDWRRGAELGSAIRRFTLSHSASHFNIVMTSSSLNMKTSRLSTGNFRSNSIHCSSKARRQQEERLKSLNLSPMFISIVNMSTFMTNQ